MMDRYALRAKGFGCHDANLVVATEVAPKRGRPANWKNERRVSQSGYMLRLVELAASIRDNGLARPGSRQAWVK
jgi:hypothetical protein